MKLPRLTPDYYHPNSDDGFEPTPLPPDPMTFQRPWTHENDVTIRLRRCIDPLPNTSAYWMKTDRPLSVEPLELEIAQQLPNVCPGHGRPAVARALLQTYFYDTELHPRFHRQRLGRDMAIKPLTLNPSTTSAPVSTIVVGEWPICDRCVRISQRYRRLSRLLLWLMATNLVAVIVVSVADIDVLLAPLVFALFPGSLFGLVVFFLLRNKAAQRVTYRPIYDERFAFVQAHPHFCEALEEDSRRHPSLEK